MRQNFAESSSETKVGNLFAEICEFPRFLEKTPGTEKCNGVITLPWRLPLQWNPDHRKFSTLYNKAVVTFSYMVL